ncbi:hypothetical protein FA15DRAFT_709202 [Coprinopsis marcescibilis]|uniref:E3 ubiquitin ligase complex SCF subunit n=1 Tax=Coprinopsis marcescibilis TaxID=230819 RepID=A0A5C3KGI1_COPMA|nr:hypothetical protein FA15DRAFT_709202 [Coprinopsis marcescibilis]
MVLVETADGVLVNVDDQVAAMSMLLREIRNSFSQGEYFPTTINVDYHILSKVIEYCEYHKHEKMKLLSINDDYDTNIENICQWDWDYIDSVDNIVLIQILAAAEELDIRDLFDLGLARFLILVKDRTASQIDTLFMANGLGVKCRAFLDEIGVE